MVWIGESGIFAIAAAWLYLPGLLVALAAGLRGLALWAFAPVGSIAALSLAALVFGFLGIPWIPWTAAVAGAGFAGIIWALRAALRPSIPRRGERGGGRWLVLAGVVVGVAFVTLRLVLYIGAPDNPSQTNDGVFHLNVLRYIVASHSASSLDVTGMLGISTFYPAAWHAPASLVEMTTGVGVVTAANVTSIVIAALVWTTGLAWFTLVASRGDRVAASVASALAGAMAAFPLLMLQWGVLYPSLLAIALLPAALAVVVRIPEALRDSAHRVRDIIWSALVLAIALSAVALAQPSLILIWGVMAGLFGIWSLVAGWGSLSGGWRTSLLALTGAYFLALALVWGVFGRYTTGIWPPSGGRAEALFDILSNGFVGFPAAWGLSVLLLAGLLASVKVGAFRWLVGGWIVLALLYFVVRAVGNPTVRFIVAPFYSDPYRLAAVMPLVVLPLAGIGFSWIANRIWLLVRTPDRSLPVSAPGRRFVGVLLALVAAVQAALIAVAPITQWHDVWEGDDARSTWYDLSDSSYLSIDERALLLRLPDVIPNELVVGNPSTGMAYAYALADQPTYPLTWQPPMTDAYGILASRLNDVASDPSVCEAVESIGARYVLDFGPGDRDYGHYVLPGFTAIEGRDGFELVDRAGRAVLWRITACD